MLLLGGTSAPALPGWAVVAVIDVSAIDYDELELLGEVHRMVGKARELAGSAPAVGSPQWWDAEPMARIAGLLVLAEHQLVHDPDRIAAEQLKAVSVAISTGMDWSAAAHGLVFDSHAKVVQRRRELGPLAALRFDPVAAARWVETGSSQEPAA